MKKWVLLSIFFSVKVKKDEILEILRSPLKSVYAYAVLTLHKEGKRPQEFARGYLIQNNETVR